MMVMGMMSGTSHDGIDSAIVDFALRGEVLEATLVIHDTYHYAPALRQLLVRALPPGQTRFEEVCQLDTEIGQAFARAALQAMTKAGVTGAELGAIGSHGQTVFHWVEGAQCLGTLQIGQPAWIAEATGVPVVSDLRMRDVTVGGHGAPLTSTLDSLLTQDAKVAMLNLGGIANVTIVDGAQTVAYDIGPANALIDGLVMRAGVNDLGYDEGGRLARAGQVHGGLLAELLRDPYFALAAPKTTGKEHFNVQLVDAALARLGLGLEGLDGGNQAGALDAGRGAGGDMLVDARADQDALAGLSLADAIATVTQLTIETVATAIAGHGCSVVLVHGGGSRNPVLMAGLAEALPGASVRTSAETGMPSQAKEAILMALIAWLTMHGLPGTVAGATGSREPRILGSITPGQGPLVMPEPLAVGPRSLVMVPKEAA